LRTFSATRNAEVGRNIVMLVRTADVEYVQIRIKYVKNFE